jgi:hypothetical protein
MIHGIFFAGLEHHCADTAWAELSVWDFVSGMVMREDVLFSGGGIAALVARENEVAVLHIGNVNARQLCVELELAVGHFDIA